MPVISGSVGQSYLMGLPNGGKLMGTNNSPASSSEIISTRGKGGMVDGAEAREIVSGNGSSNPKTTSSNGRRVVPANGNSNHGLTNGMRSPNNHVVVNRASNHVSKNRHNFTLPPALTKSASLSTSQLRRESQSISRPTPRTTTISKTRNGLTTINRSVSDFSLKPSSVTSRNNSVVAQQRQRQRPETQQQHDQNEKAQGEQHHQQNQQEQQPQQEHQEQQQEQQKQQQQQKQQYQQEQEQQEQIHQEQQQQQQQQENEKNKQQQQERQQQQQHLQQHLEQQLQQPQTEHNQLQQNQEQPSRPTPPPPPPTTPTKGPGSYSSKRKLRLARAAEFGKDSILPVDNTHVNVERPAPERKFVRAAVKGKDLARAAEFGDNILPIDNPRANVERPTIERKFVRAAVKGKDLARAPEFGKDNILPIDSPQVNVERPIIERKFVRAAVKGKDILLPSTSLDLSNSEKGTSRVSPDTAKSSSPTPRQKRGKHVIRAAEAGKDSLLPEWDRANSKYRSFSNSNNSVSSGTLSISRARFNSTPILNGWNGGASRSTCSVDSGEYSEDMEMTGSTSGASLRRRDRNRMVDGRSLDMLEEHYHSSDDGSGPAGSHGSLKNRRPSNDHSDSPYRAPSLKSHHNYRSNNQFYLQKFMTMKLGSFLRVITVVLFLVLVWDANRKASYTSQRLQLFKSEENVVMLHLHRLEKQLLFLHENLERLSSGGSGTKGDQKPVAGNDSGEGNIPAVDVALINKQKQQLFQMEEELNHEVRSLQMQIQKSARRSIVQEYGEGPIQVNVDLQFDRRTPGGKGAVTTSEIGILLWHDTPHAAWTWLEQITTNVWDGATFQLDNSRILAAEPIPFAAGNKNNNGSSRLEFVEQGERGHKAWTVGLMESSSGTLRFFINLQDNSSFSRYYVCIGKIINGFDTLQRLVETSRNVEGGGKPVTIVSAKATHLTRRDSDTIYQ